MSWRARRRDGVEYTVYETDAAGMNAAVRITDDEATAVLARILADPVTVVGSLHWDCRRCGIELTADLDPASLTPGAPGLAFAPRLHYCDPRGLLAKLRCLARGSSLAGYVLTPALPPGIRQAER